jgi:tRNA G37 N-methylase Trm5
MDIPYILLVDAFIEQVSCGIRKMCVTSVALDELAIIEQQVQRINKINLGVLIVNDDFIDKESGAVSERQYSILIFHPNCKQQAEELKSLLEKHTESTRDHKRIGKRLGYSRRAIRDFVKND